MVALTKAEKVLSKPVVSHTEKKRSLSSKSNIYNKKFIENFFNILFLACGILCVAFVLLISLFLIISGIPAIREIGVTNFLFGKVWNAQAEILNAEGEVIGHGVFGILPFIVTSVYGTAAATVISFPIGLLTAVFLSKIANKTAAGIIHKSVELLAGIPSVIYGLVGLIVVVPAVQSAFNLSSGANLFSAIIILALMILPYMITISEEALRSVPVEYEHASLALGATEIETYFKVSLKSAKSGIMSAVIQAIGRALGEAMAIIMVAGNVANLPGLRDIFKSVRFLTTAIVSEMSYAEFGSLHRNALFSIGFVLFLFIMLINTFLHFIKKEEN